MSAVSSANNKGGKRARPNSSMAACDVGRRLDRRRPLASSSPSLALSSFGHGLFGTLPQRVEGR